MNSSFLIKSGILGHFGHFWELFDTILLGVATQLGLLIPILNKRNPGPVLPHHETGKKFLRGNSILSFFIKIHNEQLIFDKKNLVF